MTRPLTGYEKEIAILHAEANQSVELIEEFKELLNRHKQAVERARKLHTKATTLCHACYETYPCSTIRCKKVICNK